MSEPKYDEDLVNLGYLKRVISDTEEGINIDFKNVSRHYGSQPIPPYYEGDTWVDGNIVYTCINTRLVGSYTAADWTTESGALQKAESKNRVFLTQPSNYKPGDMWILQSDNDHRAGTKGEILISTAGRAVYDSDDWINMLGYGTIRSINEVAGNLNNAITRIGVVEEAIEDGLIITFYQASVPEGVHIGDLWYVTGTVTGYTQGKIYRYNGSTWDLLNDPAIQQAFTEANNARLVADGKIQSFYSASEPTTGDIGVGDLWIDTDDNNKLYRYNGTNWVACYDTRIDGMVETVEETTERVTSIETDLGEIDLTVSETTTRVTTLEGAVDNIKDTTGTAEGYNIHIEDSAEEPIIEARFDGETQQGDNPSPDYPQEIENVVGNIGIKVTGKNFFNENDWYKSLNSIDTTSISKELIDNEEYFKFKATNSNIRNYKYMEGMFKENTQYTISFLSRKNNAGEAVSTGFQFVYTDDTIDTIYITDTTETLKILSSNGNKTISYIKLSYANGFFALVRKIQLEEGTATEYEPYKEQIVYFPLAEGQKLMQGSYLADDGIHNVRGQVILDGSNDEDWTVYAGSDAFSYTYVVRILGSAVGFQKSLCSHFKNVNYTWVNTIGKVGQYCDHPSGVNKYFNTDKSTLALWKAWLQSNPITVEYELPEEEIIPYTTDQQAAWEQIEQLHTYKNITNIYSYAYAHI